MAFIPSPADRAMRAAMAAALSLPDRVLTRLAGGEVVVDGQRLDPQFSLGLRLIALAREPALVSLSVPAARSALERQAWLVAGPPARVGSIRDLQVPGPGGDIAARLYLPIGVHGPLPLVVWYHGGGWTLGSIDSHDCVSRALCAEGEVAVLSVGYRLAPEHRFPAAFDDALAAFRWAHDRADALGVDPRRIAVSGDSAGGNLAAAVALATTRDGGPAPAFQMLIVPAVDLSRRTRSRDLFGAGFSLTDEDIEWYVAHYLGPDGDPTDPRVSPLLVDSLAGLPPAYIAVAGFDPLRDEGEAYAERLREARVPVSLRRHPGAIHPFFSTRSVRLGRRALTEAVGALRVGLGVSSG